MAVHEHKMTRLHVGPPKRYYCETPGCDYEVAVDATRVVMKDAPAFVTSTVAAMNGEVMVTPTQIPVVVASQPPIICPQCGWTMSPEEQRAEKAKAASERMAKARAARKTKKQEQANG